VLKFTKNYLKRLSNPRKATQFSFTPPMSYGSGQPAFKSVVDPSASIYSSYQTEYENTLSSALRTNAASHHTAAKVTNTLSHQRGQIQNASSNARSTIEDTVLAAQHLKEIRDKMLAKKRRLKAIILLLCIANLGAIWRMGTCRGRLFFCDSRFDDDHY